MDVGKRDRSSDEQGGALVKRQKTEEQSLVVGKPAQVNVSKMPCFRVVVAGIVERILKSA
jgi:hypothetical protein